MRRLNTVLVTGGYGFIGSNFINFLLNNPEFTGRIINVDCLTYAANSPELCNFERFNCGGKKRYFFEKADICDKSKIFEIFEKYSENGGKDFAGNRGSLSGSSIGGGGSSIAGGGTGIDTIVHFAAESHVDRSISGPEAFIKTNVNGTFNLLEAARTFWNSSLDCVPEGCVFHHVSTDEVYGSLGAEGKFTENSPYRPNSPYSASKASSDFLVYSYFKTYGLPVTVSNCSNNFGPFQNEEKLIPHTISRILKGEKIPVYGDGKNVRDWLFVQEHCKGLWKILKNSSAGEKWNLGGECEVENIELVKDIVKIVCQKKNLDFNEASKLITFVEDRAGHDFRYAIDCSKAKEKLGWKPSIDFKASLKKTIDWYLSK